MEQRFWSKVIRTGEDECWDWTARKDKNGYACFDRSFKHPDYAHRVAWELTNGPIPEGLLIRHKCRGKCVNPRHLELGTHAENSGDMIRDGTSPRGERNARTVLTEDQVREIKRRLRTPKPGLVVNLAKEYGVCSATISLIKNGKNWGWLTEDAGKEAVDHVGKNNGGEPEDTGTHE